MKFQMEWFIPKMTFGVDLLINLVIYKTIELHLQDGDHLRTSV